MLLIIKILYYISFFVTFVYGLYFSITGFVGIIIRKKQKYANKKKYNNFAILIAARNEEKVIGNLIDSLKNLDYPSDNYKIYVIPNNCTDNTSSVSSKLGAELINCDVKTKTKGEVLKFAFSKLKDNKEIDAYVVFDADNVVHKDFLKHMNKCLNSGYRVAEGFRDAKNPSDNWISGSYTIFYLFQNVFFNQTRMSMGGSCSINGTGFMIKKELIDKEGFETYTLTEDVEFTGQCAYKNEKIAFVEDAITYDEYPTGFITSWKQRKRWSLGNIQCMKLYTLKLLKNYMKTGSLHSLDMALTYLGPFMQVLSFINFVILILFKILKIKLYDIFSYIFASGIICFIVIFLFGIGVEIFTILYKKKSVKELASGIIMFFIFIFSWIPINIVCFFKKKMEWEEIKHTRNISIDEINN